MKGISPLIAAVLLIAFTVAVGGIVSLFFTSFTKQTTSGVSSQGQALIACGTSAPTVDLARQNTTSGNVTIVYSNPGSLPLYNVVGYISLANASTFSISGVQGGAALAAFASNSTSFIGNVTFTTVSEVRVVGVCVTSSGNLTVSGSCVSGQSCMSVIV